MKIVRNILLAGIAWRLIAQRRAALAHERRARRIAPLLLTAGGAGAILAARPGILEGARRLWDFARRQPSGETSMPVHRPQPVAEKERTERQESLRHQGQRASSIGPRSTSNSRALAATEPKPGMKRRKRRVRAKQSEKSGDKSALGAKPRGEQRSAPGAESGEPLKH